MGRVPLMCGSMQHPKSGNMHSFTTLVRGFIRVSLHAFRQLALIVLVQIFLRLTVLQWLVEAAEQLRTFSQSFLPDLHRT